ncbi:NUDIX hydrolase [Isobaculum melis]|uniref:8-oxo-dGTP diphosphatase n=1 Tax=Isobaculum melis TaxID=142588 RepID=A0A1H9SQM0_9LACT|nr:NUDIX domain-containing protein [Isobaculum melis]SER86629.1 mutator mutT protein [Isobaculum melis]
MREEQLDIYTREGQLTGRTFTRGTRLHKGDYQLAASVVLIDDHNRYLLTQRHPDKQAGLLWEFSGGAVGIGETSYQAAFRELYEEIGVSVEPDETLFIGTICEEAESLLVDVYLAYHPVSVASLVLQENEVIAAKKVTTLDIMKMQDKKEITTFDWKIFCLADEYLKKGHK